MPAKKATTSKKAAAKKPAATSRTPSDTHKAAMAAGREAGRVINAYLTALETFRPERGRQLSRQELEKRLRAARKETENAGGVARLLALQLVEDLEQRVADFGETTAEELKKLESAFVKTARRYSDSKGISYNTWQRAGVPPALLKRAGITKPT